jgi:oxysterol-binding protein 1
LRSEPELDFFFFRKKLFFFFVRKNMFFWLLVGLLGGTVGFLYLQVQSLKKVVDGLASRQGDMKTDLMSLRASVSKSQSQSSSSSLQQQQQQVPSVQVSRPSTTPLHREPERKSATDLLSAKVRRRSRTITAKNDNEKNDDGGGEEISTVVTTTTKKIKAGGGATVTVVETTKKNHRHQRSRSMGQREAQDLASLAAADQKRAGGASATAQNLGGAAAAAATTTVKEKRRSASANPPSSAAKKAHSDGEPAANGDLVYAVAPPNEAERADLLLEDMLSFGTKVTVKRLWHKRVVRLDAAGWLSYHERKKGSPASGWINLRACRVFCAGKKTIKLRAPSGESLFLFAGGAKKSARFGTRTATLRLSKPDLTMRWYQAMSDFARAGTTDELDELDDDDSLSDSELSDGDTAFTSTSAGANSDDDLLGDDLLGAGNDSDGDDDGQYFRGTSLLAASGMPPPQRPASSQSQSQSQQEQSGGMSVSQSESAVHKTVASASSAAAAASSSSRRLKRTESLRVVEPEAAAAEEEPVEAATEEKRGLLETLKKAVGSDLTAISMPISVHEPTSFLQRMAENVQYNRLLAQAAQTDDPVRQIMLTAVFAVSTYACNTRTGKPFNPYLGETYEFEDKRSNVRFFAEQVSHHPPIGACQLDGPGFVFSQEQAVRTKFGGNNLDVTPTGPSHVRYASNNNHVTWEGVRTVVYNIIVGSMWVDHFGESTLVSLSSGERAKIKMTKCGWFSKGRYEVAISVLDSRGKEQYALTGKWNESIQIGSKKCTDGEVIWTNDLAEPRPGDSYKLSEHVYELMECSEEHRRACPETDSRFRGDVCALQQSDKKKAAAEKHALEERQRARRRRREAAGEQHQPAYFCQQGDDTGSDSSSAMWTYNNRYWEERAERLAANP